VRKISEELKQELGNDVYYTKCCISYLGGCSGRIEWHHNLIYQGRQENARFCILPVCHAHHEIEKRKDIGQQLDWVMLNRISDNELQKYCKAVNYLHIKNTLNKEYGIYYE